MSDEYVEPWWGPVDPDVLVLMDRSGLGQLSHDTWPPEEFLDELVVELRKRLQALGNQATLLVDAADVPDGEDLPDSVYAVVTNVAVVAEWARSWGGNLVVLDRAGGDVVARGRTIQRFGRESMSEALRFISEEIAAVPNPGPELGITVVEHRRLEVVLRTAQTTLSEARLSDEDRLLLQAAVETLRSQLTSPLPDRHIIGRVLRRFAAVGGGVTLGVAGNLVTDLLRHFQVPWP